ncbi:MAG: hypothetical protein HZC46_07020 [Ignavibacterium album]|uniref:hypothetical protein n=1 Tax=Ignavibacterium album TaxID=591197 RepID=UPI0026EC107F|nr:hypothetical protein [Ignavibacterium album]MBI5661881.1 hypothetical protein [Ignavibacterium album]
MQKKILIFVLIIISSLSIFAQGENLKSVFLSVHSGIFLTSIEDFDKTYDSQLGLVYGLGIGLPLSTRSYLYGKATYFSKRGTPVIQTYNFENGTPVLVSETREGSASYTQWIFNGGFLYNFFLSRDWTFGLNGGFTYSTISEEQKNNSGTVSLSVDGSGIFGFFIGGVLEKNFNQSPFSIFIEPQFNFSRSDVLRYVGNYGGLNLNVGARFYFKERRLE